MISKKKKVFKVQLTPQFFFRWTKSSYHPAYLCEKILVIAFFLIFYNFSKFQILAVLAATTELCGEWVRVLLWRHRRSSTFASNTDFSWNLLLESCPTPVLFSVVAEQPIPKEVSALIEFLSLMTHARKTLKKDGNGWTLSSRGELTRSQPFLQRYGI